MYDYSDMLSLNEKMDEVSLWYYSNRCKSMNEYKIKCYIYTLKSLEMCKYISLKEFKRMLGIINTMSSAWIEELALDKYVHLDMLTVKKEKRGLGLTRKLMEPMLKKVDEMKLPCTIETQNKDNVFIYSKFGFEVVKEIKLPNSTLVQYCLLRK